MPANDTPRRQMLSSNLKSAITTAAIVGAIGGWAAFGTQQTAVTNTTTQTAAQADTNVGTTSQSAASAASQAVAVQPVAVTRSSS